MFLSIDSGPKTDVALVNMRNMQCENELASTCALNAWRCVSCYEGANCEGENLRQNIRNKFGFFAMNESNYVECYPLASCLGRRDIAWDDDTECPLPGSDQFMDLYEANVKAALRCKKLWSPGPEWTPDNHSIYDFGDYSEEKRREAGLNPSISEISQGDKDVIASLRQKNVRALARVNFAAEASRLSRCHVEIGYQAMCGANFSRDSMNPSIYR